MHYNHVFYRPTCKDTWQQQYSYRPQGWYEHHISWPRSWKRHSIGSIILIIIYESLWRVWNNMLIVKSVSILFKKVAIIPMAVWWVVVIQKTCFCLEWTGIVTLAFSILCASMGYIYCSTGSMEKCNGNRLEKIRFHILIWQFSTDKIVDILW